MNKKFKIMFLTTLILGSTISISSYSWLSAWIGLEINLMSMIPLMLTKKNILSTESSIKYFISQSMASSILIMTIVLMMKLSTVEEFSSLSIIMKSALLMKMGMAPFHFWFPEVMEGLSWFNCLIMMTWQKLAPMILVMYNSLFPMFNEIIILVSMLTSGLMSFNQISMRKLLAYSSINHMGWMMASLMLFQTIWLIYFLVYTFISINITWVLSMKKIYSINQLYLNPMNTTQNKLFFSINFLNLSGLPPFLGFMPKWMTIEVMVNSNMIMLALTMVISTLIMIFIYLKISITSIIMNTSETNWNLWTHSKQSMYMSMSNFFSLSMLMISTLIFNMA